jgi:hypothetical protein
MKRLLWLLVAALTVAPSVRAESLGDAAKREEERRKKIEESGEGSSPVIHETELWLNKGKIANEGGSAPATPADLPSGSSAAKANSSSATTPQKKDSKGDAAAWAARTAPLETRVREAERALEAAKAAPLSTGVGRTVYVDSNGGYYGSQDSGASYESAKKYHEESVAKAQARLDAARKALEALEDEARRQSIPPGWLRGN